VTAAPVLQVEDLHVWFDIDAGELHAVQGVGFDLRPGERMGLVLCGRVPDSIRPRPRCRSSSGSSMADCCGMSSSRCATNGSLLDATPKLRGIEARAGG